MAALENEQANLGNLLKHANDVAVALLYFFLYSQNIFYLKLFVKNKVLKDFIYSFRPTNQNNERFLWWKALDSKAEALGLSF